MKVLDLGASDGYIARWVADQFPDATVDAIDLSVAGAATAQRRLHGRGRAVVGRAEDAPKYFEEGTYDAVVAFELLEHVPDPDQLLDVCERMVKPDGRVYLSTPDGTFGEGGNPHHLRVYRAQDVADVLRRRGRIESLTVPPDGVTVAAYTPTERVGHVIIHTAGGWERWRPSDIAHRGLGGSETAAVRLAEHLDRAGWVVTVYGEVDDTLWGGAVFRHHTRWDPAEPCDVFIASRAPGLVAAPFPHHRCRTALWVHDVDCGDTLTPDLAERFDTVLALSRWHAGHLRDRYPHVRAKIATVTNGIEPGLFDPVAWEDREPRVLYTSSPDRGLDILLEVWPQVRERVPDAILEHCYADVYDRVADMDPAVAAHRERIRELADQPGVTRLGALPQPTLAALMCRSRVWAHPSFASMHADRFHETSCIGAMEAQAAGCHVVAAGWGALTETVRHGTLIDIEDTGSDGWRAAFVDAIVAALTDPAIGARAVAHATEAQDVFSWERAASVIIDKVTGPLVAG